MPRLWSLRLMMACDPLESGFPLPAISSPFLEMMLHFGLLSFAICWLVCVWLCGAGEGRIKHFRTGSRPSFLCIGCVGCVAAACASYYTKISIACLILAGRPSSVVERVAFNHVAVGSIPTVGDLHFSFSYLFVPVVLLPSKSFY